MIKIERPDYKYPGKLSAKMAKSQGDLRSFFSRPLNERIQETAKFDQGIWAGLRAQLFKVFFGKCVYCETRIVGDIGNVDKFRPKIGAVNSDKTKSPDHYWWLAYEWENLYLSCGKCNFSKGSKFPVRTERAPSGSSIADIRHLEDALLVDPCFDDPDQHLAFSDTGSVSPMSDRGKVTIEILDLNRQTLVEARSAEIATVSETLAIVISAGKDAEAWIKKTIRPSEQYSAAKRQCLHRFLKERSPALEAASDLVGNQKLIAEIETATPYISSRHQSQLDDDFLLDQKKSETAETETLLGTEFLYNKTQYITKVVLHNFRAIEDLTITLPDQHTGEIPWAILLGENGAGKSSILKAIALTLISEKKRKSLDIAPRDVLRRGAGSGYVEVHLAGYSEPFRLDFNKRKPNFISDPNVLHSLFFAYGGTRLLPHGRCQPRKNSDDYSRISNLFDPFLPLIEANKWLLGLDKERFEFSALAIKTLLAVDEEKYLTRRPKSKPRSVVLESADSSEMDELASLSDGYQSMIALVMDILEIMLKHYDFVADSEGIILIDEIDVHLHPRWKVQILSRLREVFPRVQFIVTTHDPLCLLGSRSGEVHILKRQAETGRVEIVQQDIPPGTTADQVLTGYWFGLNSTLDGGTLSLLDQHRQILRLVDENKSTPKLIEERNELETQLRGRLGSFADTSIDKMAQSVASEVIEGKISEIDFSKRSEIREAIKDKLEALISGQDR